MSVSRRVAANPPASQGPASGNSWASITSSFLPPTQQSAPVSTTTLATTTRTNTTLKGGNDVSRRLVPQKRDLLDPKYHFSHSKDEAYDYCSKYNQKELKMRLLDIPPKIKKKDIVKFIRSNIVLPQDDFDEDQVVMRHVDNSADITLYEFNEYRAALILGKTAVGSFYPEGSNCVYLTFIPPHLTHDEVCDILQQHSPFGRPPVLLYTFDRTFQRSFIIYALSFEKPLCTGIKRNTVGHFKLVPDFPASIFSPFWLHGDIFTRQVQSSIEESLSWAMYPPQGNATSALHVARGKQSEIDAWYEAVSSPNANGSSSGCSGTAHGTANGTANGSANGSARVGCNTGNNESLTITKTKPTRQRRQQKKRNKQHDNNNSSDHSDNDYDDEDQDHTSSSDNDNNQSDNDDNDSYDDSYYPHAVREQSSNNDDDDNSTYTFLPITSLNETTYPIAQKMLIHHNFFNTDFYDKHVYAFNPPSNVRIYNKKNNIIYAPRIITFNLLNTYIYYHFKLYDNFDIFIQWINDTPRVLFALGTLSIDISLDYEITNSIDAVCSNDDSKRTDPKYFAVTIDAKQRLYRYIERLYTIVMDEAVKQDNSTILLIAREYVRFFDSLWALLAHDPRLARSNKHILEQREKLDKCNKNKLIECHILIIDENKTPPSLDDKMEHSKTLNSIISSAYDKYLRHQPPPSTLLQKTLTSSDIASAGKVSTKKSKKVIKGNSKNNGQNDDLDKNPELSPSSVQLQPPSISPAQPTIPQAAVTTVQPDVSPKPSYSHIPLPSLPTQASPRQEQQQPLATVRFGGAHVAIPTPAIPTQAIPTPATPTYPPVRNTVSLSSHAVSNPHGPLPSDTTILDPLVHKTVRERQVSEWQEQLKIVQYSLERSKALQTESIEISKQAQDTVDLLLAYFNASPVSQNPHYFTQQKERIMIELHQLAQSQHEMISTLTNGTMSYNNNNMHNMYNDNHLINDLIQQYNTYKYDKENELQQCIIYENEYNQSYNNYIKYLNIVHVEKLYQDTITDDIEHYIQRSKILTQRIEQCLNV